MSTTANHSQITSDKSYNNNNIFAKILRKEIPSVPVYEDQNVFAFMDVMPQSEGHMLLIPKKASRNILDADPDVLPHLIQVAQKLAEAAKKALQADGVTIMQFNEEAAGQTVFHLHFHVVPRYEGQALKLHNSEMENLEKLENLASKIQKAL